MLTTRNSMLSMPGAWADERGDGVRDGLPAGDRRQRNIVIDGVVGEKCGEFGGPGIRGPRRAEPAHDLDRAFHVLLLRSISMALRRAPVSAKPADMMPRPPTPYVNLRREGCCDILDRLSISSLSVAYSAFYGRSGFAWLAYPRRRSGAAVGAAHRMRLRSRVSRAGSSWALRRGREDDIGVRRSHSTDPRRIR